jgi:hypothetical protein
VPCIAKGDEESRAPELFHLRADGGVGRFQRRFRPQSGTSADANEREQGDVAAKPSQSGPHSQSPARRTSDYATILAKINWPSGEPMTGGAPKVRSGRRKARLSRAPEIGYLSAAGFPDEKAPRCVRGAGRSRGPWEEWAGAIDSKIGERTQ